jgi:hypothetical protein
MKKLLILVAMFIGSVNAEIIKLKCSNQSSTKTSDITIYIDVHEKTGWLDNFVPLYVLKVTPEFIHGYSHNQFTRDELKTITNPLLTARLDTFYKKVEKFTINRTTLDWYSPRGIVYYAKGHGKCNIAKDSNKI